MSLKLSGVEPNFCVALLDREEIWPVNVIHLHKDGIYILESVYREDMRLQMFVLTH